MFALGLQKLFQAPYMMNSGRLNLLFKLKYIFCFYKYRKFCYIFFFYFFLTIRLGGMLLYIIFLKT